MILFDDWKIVKSGEVEYLLHGDKCIMDNGVIHTSIIQNHASKMYGTILVTGLGMGIILEAATQNPNIENIVCVEIEPKLIDYFKPAYPSVVFVQADAKKWRPTKLFDFIWHDIFSELNAESVAEYEFLKLEYAPYCTREIFGLFDGYYEAHPQWLAIRDEVLHSRLINGHHKDSI